MKALIINDTSHHGHNGSKEVVKILHECLEAADFNVCESLPTGQFPPDDFDYTQVDLVVANGEGTMHDDAPNAVAILKCLRLAHKAGVKTALVNTAFRCMSKGTDVLCSLDLVTTREILSQMEMEACSSRLSIRIPDLAFATLPQLYRPRKTDVTGWFLDRPNRSKDPNIVECEWIDFVRELHGARSLITGLQHEVIAAIRARCPFVAVEGNIPKIEGIIQTANALIPVFKRGTPDEVLIAARDNLPLFQEEFNRLFDYYAKESETIKERMTDYFNDL